MGGDDQCESDISECARSAELRPRARELGVVMGGEGCPYWGFGRFEAFMSNGIQTNAPREAVNASQRHRPIARR